MRISLRINQENFPSLQSTEEIKSGYKLIGHLELHRNLTFRKKKTFQIQRKPVYKEKYKEDNSFDRYQSRLDNFLNG